MTHGIVELIVLLPFLLLVAAFWLVLLRGVYSFIFRHGKSLHELAARYPRKGPRPDKLSYFGSAKLPAMTDLATGVGFGPEGMTVTHDGLFGSAPDSSIPWQHLRIDLDFGFMVVVEVVPERTQFLLLLGAITREQVRRIRQAAASFEQPAG